MRSTRDGCLPSHDVGRGDVKTPPLWHTAAKMPVGRWYSDGSFHGRIPLMASSMELEKDRSFDALVEVGHPANQAGVRLGDSSPAGRRAIRTRSTAALAERGRALFNSRAVGCAECHGVYDGAGGVDWPGRHTDVGTDRAQARGRVSGLRRRVLDKPPGQRGRAPQEPRLRRNAADRRLGELPYLHNGSVPTLHHLLGPVSERPAMFEVMAARTLDRERVGQPLYRDLSDGALGRRDVSGNTAPIATGSTRRGRAARTQATISGRGFGRTTTAGRSSNT